ncbi:hypothetical protein GCM10022258_41360 [Aquimarina gracilis]
MKQSASYWSPIYKNDKQGNTVFGNKKDLINAIRKGALVRIGWGAKGKNHSIEHLSDPIWIAILDETEVIVHLDPQVLSAIDWENLTANYADSTLIEKEWRVVLDTKGNFDAIWYDPVTRKTIEHRPQNQTITWFVKGIDTKTDIKSLFEE